MKRSNHNKNHKINQTHKKHFYFLTLSFTFQHKNNHFIFFYFVFYLFMFLHTKLLHNLQEFNM
jgi:hypothetical protein